MINAHERRATLVDFRPTKAQGREQPQHVTFEWRTARELQVIFVCANV